jgi:hypothetical protein
MTFISDNINIYWQPVDENGTDIDLVTYVSKFFDIQARIGENI